MQLGAKKAGGLGAQKVKKDFSEIEREAEMADQVKNRIEEDRKVDEAKRIEEESKAAANMRLAYQDISLQQKKRVSAQFLFIDPNIYYKSRANISKIYICPISIQNIYISGREITQCRCEEGGTSGTFGYGGVCFIQRRGWALGFKSNEYNCTGK